ncbi:GerMN domain-containing protein [Eubacterium ruminantium]|uniref:GerMN domain-containing protein n=1 Tax=Eubacterium ruminantium TaxID=42322 RepID=UPI002479FB1A|nr:GerMN domain-containing protein [Eubacterium ruminantium]
MSKKKNKVLICLFFAGIMSFVSCGKNADKKKKNEDIPKENIVNIYHSEEQGIAIGDEYLLKQPDSFNASVEEVVSAFKSEGALSIVSIIPDEYNNINITVAKKEDLSDEELLLEEAALVKTFSQIAGIGDITISFDSKDDEDSIKFTADSFFFYDEASGANNTIEVSCYIPNSQGKKLMRVLPVLEVESGESPEMAILKYLKSQGVYNEDTEIINVFTRGGICYINFSEHFQEGSRKIADEVAIYSIVDSLIGTKGINAVKIYIDGDESGKYRGKLDISEPLVFEGGLIE